MWWREEVRRASWYWHLKWVFPRGWKQRRAQSLSGAEHLEILCVHVRVCMCVCARARACASPPPPLFVFALCCTHSRSQAFVFTLLYLGEAEAQKCQVTTPRTGAAKSHIFYLYWLLTVWLQARLSVKLQESHKEKLKTGRAAWEPSQALRLPCSGGGTSTVWCNFSAETGKAGSLPLRSKRTWKRKERGRKEVECWL